ncbi:hypothetical protein [Parasitella parasitica]|uniref:Uncharacterized protein n=1 Tax=Parasitella parasitica TaxID=35722 RepID=A0A0B7MWX7_9FUNG|nr:hypothetical protein [Parasitella parasitica]
MSALANNENTIFDFKFISPPPPPYSKLSISEDDCAMTSNCNKIKQEAALPPLTNVRDAKEHISRLKMLSPLHALKRNKTSYTENTASISNIINASPSSPFMEQNKSNTMNDSLERIGTSLQQLIEEAQASLSIPSTLTPPQQEAENIVDYSYRYVQHGYMQSQEQLALAISKLEQSIQNVVYTTSKQRQTVKNYYTTHHHHHHYYAPLPLTSPSIPTSSLSPTKLWMVGLFLLFMSYCAIQPYYKFPHVKTSILLLLLAKKSHTTAKIITFIDRLVIHLVQYKHLPMIKFIHGLNMVLCVTKLLILQ